MMAPMVAVPLAILVALVSSPLVAEAQPTAKVYRVGVLSNALDTADGPSFRAFLDGLHGLGYVEHKNVDIEWRSSEGDNDQLPDLAASLVRAKVDVILAMALQPARAASEATRTTPIVFVVAADPVAQRLVTSSGGPTGNVTGVSAYDARESSEKVVELLKAATPKLSRLGVMLVPGNPVHQELMAQPLPSAAQRAGAALVPLRVETITDVQPALERAVQEKVDAIYVLGDVLTFVQRARIVDFATRSRLPTMFSYRSGADAGGLMAYGPNLRELFRRASTYVDKILKGAKPADLPIAHGGKYELTVNLKTAKALGVTIPPGVVRRADQVIR